MNILIPYTWLLEHLKTDATPEEIQKCLSLCGPSVERIHMIEGEPVLEIEITTNRVDVASVRGIAREAAVILPEFGIEAKLVNAVNKGGVELTGKEIDIDIINDPSLCHRIMAIKLTELKMGQSPGWMQKRLRQVGQRPLNNIIDITNYVMWELGHPTHVFDYDKLNYKKLIVREAKRGEKVITLDNKIYKMTGGEVVFDNGNGEIIDIPGIMGTKNTVVSELTKNIVFFIEDIDSVKIRFASMTHAIRSQAATLNEKGVDPNLAKEALIKGLKYYLTLTKAKVASRILDIYPIAVHTLKTVVTHIQIENYLGVKIQPKRVDKILSSLGCKIKLNQIGYEIEPPTYRARDLVIPEDYIEEIARIYGYHNLPSRMMATTIPYNPPLEDFNWEHQLKMWLTGWGANEIYSYSMVAEKIALESGYPVAAHLKIINPLTKEWKYMRRSLTPSLIQVAKNNPKKEVVLFEMQKVYHPRNNDLPMEEMHLTILSNKTYEELRGVLEALMIKNNVIGFSVGANGEVVIEKERVGKIEKVGDYWVADILIDNWYKYCLNHPTKLFIFNYPPIIEDLTFTLRGKVHLGEIIDSVKAVNQMIVAVELKIIYKLNYTLTITYRLKDQNLTNETVAPVRKKVVKTLEANYGAKLVGNLAN